MVVLDSTVNRTVNFNEEYHKSHMEFLIWSSDWS